MKVDLSGESCHCCALSHLLLFDNERHDIFRELRKIRLREVLLEGRLILVSVRIG